MKITLTGQRRSDHTEIVLMQDEVVTSGVTLDHIHEKAVEAFGAFLYCINVSDADTGSFICGAIDDAARTSLQEFYGKDGSDLYHEEAEDSYLDASYEDRYEIDFYDDEPDIYGGTYSEM